MTSGVEFFDPKTPHIGFSGSDFDPPGSVTTGYTPEIKAAGEAMGEAAAQTQQQAEDNAALAAANEAAILAQAEAVAAATIALGTKAEKADIPTDVPSYVSLNPVEDVSFPRSDLEPIPRIVNGQTSNESGDSYHSHAHNAVISWTDPVYTPPDRRIDVAFVNAVRNRIYNTVGFEIGPLSTPTPAPFYIAIYKMDTTDGRPNGSITRLWMSGNINGLFTTAGQPIRVDTPDIIAAAGDWFCIALLQVGANRRPLFCKTTAGVAVFPGINPARMSMTLANQSSFPASITKASLDTASLIVPWACMGQTFGLVGLEDIDLFDRITSDLGSSWAQFGPGATIANNDAARAKLIDYGHWTNRNNWTRCLRVVPLAKDNHSVTITLDAFPSHGRNYPTSAWVRCDSTMSRGVSMRIRPGSVEIRRHTATYPAGTATEDGGASCAIVSRATNGGDVFSLHAAANEFTVYQNGTPVLSWLDSANETQIGAAFRRTGMEFFSYSYAGGIWPNEQYASVAIDEWRAKDL